MLVVDGRCVLDEAGDTISYDESGDDLERRDEAAVRIAAAMMVGEVGWIGMGAVCAVRVCRCFQYSRGVDTLESDEGGIGGPRE